MYFSFSITADYYKGECYFMVKKMSTEEANIELNARLDDGRIHVSQNSKMSTEEANMALQDEFYGKNDTSIAPTYITNETAAIKVSGNDD